MEITKICSECGEEKALSNFHVDKDKKHGKRNKCKKCSCNIAKEYRKNNKDKVKESIQKCYLEKRDEILKYKKIWGNKPINKIKNRLNGSYRQQVYRSGLKPPKTTIFDITKISPEEYLCHFEKLELFDDYFKKDNINIDHIIPISVYDASNIEDIIKCWQPENMRFINKLENEEKHNKVDIGLIKKHNIEHLLPQSLSNISSR